jgi:phosphogluconate dehydratase
VLAAIHVTPEALGAGPLSRVEDGDIIHLNANTGTLELQVPAEQLAARTPARQPPQPRSGVGREMFALFRQNAAGAEQGGGPLFEDLPV